MKKNFTVNISGSIFNIDEDAYEALNRYLQNLRDHYENEPGRDEILGDIESRIAEMLTEKTKSSQQVVNLKIIEEVIGIMGKPDEIDDNQQYQHRQSGTEKSPRRLFRDPENKVIGGVCSGIAAYFNIDMVIIRILFVVATILGLSVLIYLVLWIAIPEAKTTKEKLEMKGEKINLNNIEKNVKEEFNTIKEKLNNLTEEAKEAFSQHRKKYEPNRFEKFFSFIFLCVTYFVRALGIFIGLIFIILGLFLLVGLIASFFGAKTIAIGSNSLISSYSFNDFLNLFIDASYQVTLTYIGLSLLIGVPVIMLIYNGVKIVLGTKTRFRFIGISAFSFWLAGLIITIILSLQIARNFSSKSYSSKKIAIHQPESNRLLIDANSDNDLSINEIEERYVQGSNPFNVISKKGSDVFYGLPRLEFSSSENDSFQVVVYTFSRGNSLQDAEKHIEDIHYNLVQEGNKLLLDPVFHFSTANKWRAQDVKVLCKVPEGKIVDIGKHVKYMMYAWDAEDMNFKELNGKKWIMTPNGLKEYFEPNAASIVKDSIKMNGSH